MEYKIQKLWNRKNIFEIIYKCLKHLDIFLSVIFQYIYAESSGVWRNRSILAYSLLAIQFCVTDMLWYPRGVYISSINMNIEIYGVLLQPREEGRRTERPNFWNGYNEVWHLVQGNPCRIKINPHLKHVQTNIISYEFY